MQKNYFQTLNLIWLIISLAPFIILIVFSVIKNDLGNPELQGVFDYVAAGIALMSVLTSQTIYTIFIKQGSNAHLKRKLEIYRTAQLIKGSMLEGASVFCAVAYILTHSSWLIAFPMVILILMFMQRPSQEKFYQEMEVNESELENS